MRRVHLSFLGYRNCRYTIIIHVFFVDLFLWTRNPSENILIFLHLDVLRDPGPKGPQKITRCIDQGPARAFQRMVSTLPKTNQCTLKNSAWKLYPPGERFIHIPPEREVRKIIGSKVCWEGIPVIVPRRVFSF